MDRTANSDLERRSNLTPQQLRIWLAHEMYPEARPLDWAATLTLTARIDVDHFRHVFQALVDSSDALRTVIEDIDRVPQQRVLASVDRQVDFVDLSAAPDAAAAADAWVRSRARVRLGLSECIYDSALIKTGETSFLWLVHVDHTVFDTGSLILMMRLLARCYGQSRIGARIDRPDLPLFHDYAREQRARARSPDYPHAQAYWQENLADATEPLSFYGERSRKSATAAERLSRTLTPQQSRRLEALASEAGRYFTRTAVFAIFASVLSVVLHRISGSRRFCIGAPFHNRATPALRDTIGLVMQVVPLPVRIEEDDSFLTLLKRIEKQAVESWRHAHAFPQSLQQPAYDAVLNFHAPLDVTMDGTPVRAVLINPGHQVESLSIHVQDLAQSGALTLDFDLKCDVFPPERRELLVSQFLRVLDAVLENPRQAVAEIRLLSASDERLLLELNAGRLTLPEPLTYPALFEAQAARTPAAVAAVYEGETITYGALNGRANQLARELRGRGVGPETRVGVFLDASLDAAVAALGVLKAGGGYLPLEPRYPRDRTAFMLHDADLRHIITRVGLLDELPEHDAAVLCVDRDAPAISGQGTGNLPAELAPENVAYITYTSGSTGAPKGVVLTHRNLCGRLLWGAHTFGIDETERYLLNASWAYDAAVWALLEPWVAGGQVVIARSGDRSDGRYLLELISASGVTFIATSPTMIQALLDTGGIEACTSLLHVFAWGERLAPELVDRFCRLSKAELYNVYGQTETCISVMHWRCRAGAAVSTVPIGRPHANIQAYVLGPDLRPVPIGVPGELYIGGAGVARGYLDRPLLTAERFVANPFSNPAGDTDGYARLFRTGDLARLASDGTIELLGRTDRQVKIRGNRVELGEIEAVLARHPGVDACVVVARPSADDPRGKRPGLRLVAYLVSAVPIPAEELRSLCRKALPGFMIPGAFIRLPSLPRTSSGKINELELPAPEALEESGFLVDPGSTTKEAGSPVGNIEGALLSLWQSVIGAAELSVDDDFWSVGGDSFLAVVLLEEIAQRFSLNIPHAMLIDHPTVRELALQLEALQR